MLIKGILFLVLTGMSWVVSGIVIGRAPKDKIDVGMLVFIKAGVSCLIALAVGMGIGLPETGRHSFAVAMAFLFISGLVNNRQLVDMGRAMQEGPNGIIWSIIQCGFVVTSIVGVTCMGDRLNAWKGCGFIVLLAALLIMGLAGDNSKGKGSKHWKWLAFKAFIWTGMSQLLANLPSYFDNAVEISTVWRTAANCAGMALGTPFFALFGQERSTLGRMVVEHVRRLRLWEYVAVTIAVSMLVSIFLEYRGLDILAQANAGAVSFPLMVGSCIIAFDVYSMLALHERRSPLQFLALLLCLFGVVAICL